MSVPEEYQVSIAVCLDDITQAFKDGSAIIEKIKRKRALKRAPPPPRLLEESIDQAPSEIEREKQRGLKRYGKAFEEGDHLAVIVLQQICIQLQQSLLQKLRTAAFDDDQAITDFTYLVDAADAGRDQTIAALYDFKSRLSQAEQDEEQGTSCPVVSNTSPQSSISNLSSMPPDQLQRTNTQQSAASSTTAPPTQRQLLQEYEARRASKVPLWQQDHSQSGDVQGDEDATSGADEHSINSGYSHHHRKRNSLLHFLKHNRSTSAEMRDKDKLRDRTASFLSQRITEEPHAHSSPGSPPISVPFRSPVQCDVSSSDKQQTQASKFPYQDWNEGNSEMWNAGKNPLERRETIALAPDQPASNSGSTSHLPLQPPSPVMTHRSNSFYTARDPLANTTIQTPNPENDYLGFCKCAWKLQNGDRKGSMHKASEVNPWSRHQSVTANLYLSCQQPKCSFRSSFSCPQTDTIWNKVFIVENKGLKLRWPFLAKSHVAQKVVVKHQYSFQCLFCTFLGGKEAAGVYHGLDDYLDHINNEHRRRVMNEVLCYKTSCIQGRVAKDDEEFDINIWPPGTGGGASERKQSEWQQDDVMRDQGSPNEGWANGKDGKSDSMFSDEPWNEGLSDFHYHGALDRLESI